MSHEFLIKTISMRIGKQHMFDRFMEINKVLRQIHSCLLLTSSIQIKYCILVRTFWRKKLQYFYCCVKNVIIVMFLLISLFLNK